MSTKITIGVVAIIITLMATLAVVINVLKTRESQRSNAMPRAGDVAQGNDEQATGTPDGVVQTIDAPYGWKTYIHDDGSFGLAYPEDWVLTRYIPPGFTQTSVSLESAGTCSIKIDKIGSEVPGEWLLPNLYPLGGYNAVAWEHSEGDTYALILSLGKDPAKIPKEHRFIFRVNAYSVAGRELCEQVLSTVRFF
jgi:hypothetical protein